MENGGLGGLRKLFAILSPDADITQINEKSSLGDIAAIDLNAWAGLINFLEKPNTQKDLKSDLSADLVTKLDQLEAEELLENIPGENQIA